MDIYDKIKYEKNKYGINRNGKNKYRINKKEKNMYYKN